MPYTPAHKQKTRARIVECARILFNRHGFDNVTVDMVMGEAKLTRGGFYNHFKSKEELFAAAVSSFLMGRGAEWRVEAGIAPGRPTQKAARQMLDGYLSKAHLGDLDGQCPMIALPSDIARSAPEVQAAYEVLLKSMVALFEHLVVGTAAKKRQHALTLAAVCVGGMVIARTLPDSAIAEAVRAAALRHGKTILPTA